jgi:hypothetical protein
MCKRRARFGAALLVSVLGLALAQCTPAVSDDDDDAGAAGQGGSSSGGSGGTQAGANAGSHGGSAGATGGASHGSCDPKVVTVRPPEPAAVDEAMFAAQWPALVCAAMKPCCGTEAPAYDDAKCLAYAPTALEKTDKKYDGYEAAYCLEALKATAVACPGPTSYRGLPYSCTLVYRGVLPLGTDCDRDSLCAPDARGLVECSLQTSTCTVEIRGKVGDPCNEGCEIRTDIGICHPLNDPTDPSVITTCHGEDGVHCVYDSPSGPPAAGAGTCQPALALGCDCLLGGSDFCNGQTHCTDGLDSTCVPRAGAGSPCFLNDDCTVDNYCKRDVEPRICTPRKHAAEPCDDHDQCLGGYCWTSVCVLDSGETRGVFNDAYCDGVGTE